MHHHQNVAGGQYSMGEWAALKTVPPKGPALITEVGERSSRQQKTAGPLIRQDLWSFAPEEETYWRESGQNWEWKKARILREDLVLDSQKVPMLWKNQFKHLPWIQGPYGVSRHKWD